MTDAAETVIDAVIPTCYPDERLFRILDLLSVQTVPLRRIRVINTDRNGLEKLLRGRQITEQQFMDEYPLLTLEHIRPEEFDHGGTRNRGFHECTGAEYCLTMTQDAVPEGRTLVEELIRPMQAGPGASGIAAAYARQLPNKDASCEERLSRQFNYPETSRIKSEADVPELGVKTYFCSNVCALYRMDIWKRTGGFPEHAIFNEDMIFAGRALKAGYRICYAAEALVYHSHSYTAGQQFHRNFDLGVSQTQNPDIFGAVSSEGEGTRYVEAVTAAMRREHETMKIPAFFIRCGARLAGYRLGRSYEHLPRRFVVWCSLNRNYWNRAE